MPDNKPTADVSINERIGLHNHTPNAAIANRLIDLTLGTSIISCIVDSSFFSGASGALISGETLLVDTSDDISCKTSLEGSTS